MMVTFVSECEKKALSRTRRVLDSFANRIGARTWQTVITDQGLRSVHRHLRSTASKSTAVSCHWMRSRSRSDLLWIVGNKQRFAADGTVPVASKASGSPWVSKEHDWQHMPAIKALVAVSSLFHDWGKATRCFQEKLRSRSPKGDPLRHEWISCLLLRELVRGTSSESDASASDLGWLSALERGETHIAMSDLERGEVEPLYKLPPVAEMVAWLVLTHHRLPLPPDKARRARQRGRGADALRDVLGLVSQDWGYSNLHYPENLARLESCFLFDDGLPALSSQWRKQAAKWAARLRAESDLLAGASPALIRELLTHARLCLMLGDHHYSSRPANPEWKSEINLFANTDRKSRELKQPLDEHLCGVAGDALAVARHLPYFAEQLPRAEGLHALARRSPKRFAWQDDAVRALRQWRTSSDTAASSTRCGFFGLNMASTGCGKTIANAKIMRALSPDQASLRYTLALGLRTLTLQTGDAYRERLGMDDSQLAVVIGSRAVQELHEANKKVERSAADELQAELDAAGSESQEPLWEGDTQFEITERLARLETALRTDKDRKLLYAPVLCCTIDHIMSATECTRGGRYILPQLRLLSSDLVVDEVDDFVGEDLIAIGRLVHLTGLLGRKLLLSSATIPPDLALGFFHAYRQGWLSYALAHGASPGISAGWFDEFRSTVVQVEATSDDEETNHSFSTLHERFAKKRVKNLEAAPARRRARLIPVAPIATTSTETFESTPEHDASLVDQYVNTIAEAVLSLHADNHVLVRENTKQVSFGVVRLANVDPCIAIARRLGERSWPDDARVCVMAYHSRQVLLLRSAQERHLDAVLNRSGDEQAFLADPVIADLVANSTTKNIVFVLVATPVEEVGRDHDLDWAIVEPSSYRSIIQLAGRVVRHRDKEAKAPNIGLLQYNLRALRQGGQAARPAFCWPGFESGNFRLKTHDVTELLDLAALGERVDAVPRVLRAEALQPNSSLADLEHAVLADALTNFKQAGPEALEGYLTGSWWLTGLPQSFNRFRRSDKDIELILHATERDKLCFSQREETGNRKKTTNMVPKELLYKIEHKTAGVHNEWIRRNYLELLEALSDARRISLDEASMRYGEIMVRERDIGNGFVYSDDFGMKRKGAWI